VANGSAAAVTRISVGASVRVVIGGT
jgi:hypothetical protein